MDSSSSENNNREILSSTSPDEQQQQQQPSNVVVDIDSTNEHQVGVTEDGTEAIMGRDRSVVAESNNNNNNDNNATEMTLDEEFAAADAAANNNDNNNSNNQEEENQTETNDNNDDEAQQEQQQQEELPPPPPQQEDDDTHHQDNNTNSKIAVTNTANTKNNKSLSRKASSLMDGTVNDIRGATTVDSSAVASPVVEPPLESNRSRSSSSTATSVIMRRQQQQQQQQAQSQNQNQQQQQQQQERRSGSPARSQTSSHLEPINVPQNTKNNNININDVDTPRDDHLEMQQNEQQQNDQQLVVVPNQDPVPVPNTSQRHLYQYDQEYEDALQVYDSDVTSSEAASRFAVGLHSTAASATRHFADSCELAVDEADRIAEKRNKNAHRIRAMISNELARYGFAGVAQELSEMTNVLIEDHRRRTELLEDRVRLQMKSTLSSILREQQHAGDALRAEFVKSASVQFAQESLSKLIGGSGSGKNDASSSGNNGNDSDEFDENTGKRLTDAEKIMRSLKHENESTKEELAKEKGTKAAGDAYTNELLDRLSKIFDKQNGFAVSKAQTVVSKARANFTRLSEQLSKIEDENVRRLATQRDKAQRQISDLEALAANVGKTHIIELTETEAAIERFTQELTKVKEDKKQLEKDVWEMEEERRKKRGGGVSAGGLLFPSSTGLDYLNTATIASGTKNVNNHNNTSSNNLARTRTNNNTINNNLNASASGFYDDPNRAKNDKDMDEKFKSASARSKALEDRNAARLASFREKKDEKNAMEKNRNMNYSSRAGGGGGGTATPSLAATRRTTTNQKRSGSTPGSPSLSRQNVGRVGAMTAEEKTRRHIQEHGSLQTREVDPRDAVSIHTRNYQNNAHRSPDNNNNNHDQQRNRSPRSFQQDAWIESEALKELVSRTASHGLSFPDGSDPVIPTHKFLDDELAAIYELRHLRASPSKR